ncbi:MAG: ROK family glucokinase [Planctomycetota bacterium]|nr:ROK family glucokinase [Planctomycetota bacterium]
MAKVCVGIDLGGTFIKYALLDENMSVIGSLQLPTPADAGPDSVIETMVSGATELLAREGILTGDVVGAGIGSPGPLDLAAGVVIGMPNIPGFVNIRLRDRIGDGLGVQAVLENDANVAALGEYLCGSGKGTGVMVMLTLGTGIGGGIVIAGQLIRGAHGIGAEAGHMIIESDGQPCPCGQRGCLEQYASASAMARYARRLIEQEQRKSSLSDLLAQKGDIDASDINKARRAGDALAEEVWDRTVRYLAVGCVSITRLIDPDLIVLGGGLAKAGDDLLEPLRRHFSRLNWTIDEQKTSLILASLGNDAGVIGAAGTAWKHFGN